MDCEKTRRRSLTDWSWKKTLALALPVGAVGYALVSLGFWLRIPFDGTWPFVRPYAFAVDVEMSWEFCSLGVAMTVFAYFALIRKLTVAGGFYRLVIRPLSEASYGTYLVHIFFLSAVMPLLKERVSMPLAIFGCAALVFLGSSAFSWTVRRIPVVGRLVCG